jgi:phosphohistidine phosphatase SixA
MRYLTVVRHAQAAPGPDDFSRRLTVAGRGQCHQLRASANDPVGLGRFGPAVALVSAAVRTCETFRESFEETPLCVGFETSELIYNGRREVTGSDALFELSTFDPVTQSLIFVAHFPTVRDLVELISDVNVNDLIPKEYPLAGAFVFELPDDETIGHRRYRFVDSFVPTL